jgi:hypothetical protein
VKNIPDPVLWERAAHWTPAKRLRTAKKFERWARQLRLYTQAASMNDELDYAGTHVRLRSNGTIPPAPVWAA